MDIITDNNTKGQFLITNWCGKFVPAIFQLSNNCLKASVKKLASTANKKGKLYNSYKVCTVFDFEYRP
jgi:hypothetical protein